MLLVFGTSSNEEDHFIVIRMCLKLT